MNWKNLIVRVFARRATDGAYQYQGTAFLINDRYLLTARHVIEPFRVRFQRDQDQIVLKNGPFDGNQFLAEAPIPHPDQRIDIALLKLRIPNYRPVQYWPLVERADLIDATVQIAGFDDESLSSTAPGFQVLGEISQFSTLALQKKVEHGKSGGPVFIKQEIVGILHSRTDAPAPALDSNQSFIYPYCAFRDFLAEHRISVARFGTKPQIALEHLRADERVAQIDREAQWDRCIDYRIHTEKARKNFAFVVAGVSEEWPGSLTLRLQTRLQTKNACALHLSGSFARSGDWEREFWTELLAQFPCSNVSEESELSAIKSALRTELANSPSSLVFNCNLHPKLSSQLNLIRDIALAWEGLDLRGSSWPHFLILVHGTVSKGSGLFAGLKALGRMRGDHQVQRWGRKLGRKLGKDGTRIMTPELQSIHKDEIIHWSNTALQDPFEQTQFQDALGSLKARKIPHLTIRFLYNNIARQAQGNGKP